jgi:hypothetical protein
VREIFNILERIRNGFVINNFYWSPVNGFNIGAQKIDEDYRDGGFNNVEFIAYFGFGLFSGFQVDRQFALKRLFKDGDIKFPYKLLFIENENRTDRIYLKEDAKSLELEKAYDGQVQLDTFYICRCVQFNMDESGDKNYTSDKYFNALLDVIFKTNNVSSDIIADKNEIGAIEFKATCSQDADRIKSILNSFISSQELSDIIDDNYIAEKIKKIYI